MTEFKVGDKVKIVKNEKEEVIVSSPFKGYNYLGRISTIQGLDGNNVYLSELVCRVDISCIEHVKEVLKIKIEGKYVYKSSNGNIKISTEAPKLGKHGWKSTGRQCSTKGLIIDLNQFNWDDSLHMINDNYTLTKIEPEVCKTYIINIKNESYYYSENDMNELVKAIIDSGYIIKL